MADSNHFLMMKETYLVYFKCPGCGEMSRLLDPKDIRQTVNITYLIVACDACAEEIRLRLVGEI